jgi:hypothetical protein
MIPLLPFVLCRGNIIIKMMERKQAHCSMHFFVTGSGGRVEEHVVQCVGTKQFYCFPHMRGHNIWGRLGFVCQEEPRLAIVNESHFSFLFCERTIKMEKSHISICVCDSQKLSLILSQITKKITKPVTNHHKSQNFLDVFF